MSESTGVLLLIWVGPNFNQVRLMKSSASELGLRALANENTLLPTQVFACVHNICCGHKFCVWDTKNVSDFVQKHFASATNVSQFAQPKKHHGQQCVLVYQGLRSLSLGTAAGTAEFCEKTTEWKCLNVVWFHANMCDV